jgi:phosphoribosyl-AMP cyclohydrolase
MISLDFEKQGGLVPAVVQDANDSTVLMLAYMNAEAFEKTVETGLATYWSRSRNELWVKGKTSGHTQEVKELLIDCDNDTVLLKVVQKGGAACHTGQRSCFYRRLENGQLETISEPVFDPKEVYK